MSHKNHVLVVAKQGEVPESLQAALDGLQLQSRVCKPGDLKQISPQNAPTGAVLALESLSELADAEIETLTTQLREIAVNVLVLARQAGSLDTKDHQPVSDKLLYAPADESVEMLKGRLATLIQMRPAWKQLNHELFLLRQAHEPLDKHFTDVSQEMQLAARLQQDFLPRSLPDIPGLRFATVFRPASWVSGDIYDIMRLDEQHVGFYVVGGVRASVPFALETDFTMSSPRSPRR